MTGMTKGRFDYLVRVIWAFGNLPEPVVRAGLFAQLLNERRR